MRYLKTTKEYLEHLKSLSKTHSEFYQWLSDRAVYYPKVKSIYRKLGKSNDCLKDFRAGNCFFNSYKVTNNVAKNKFKYVEGLMMHVWDRVITFTCHAWNISKDGTVLDTTLGLRNSNLSRNHKYIGFCEMDRKDLREIVKDDVRWFGQTLQWQYGKETGGGVYTINRKFSAVMKENNKIYLKKVA